MCGLVVVDASNLSALSSNLGNSNVLKVVAFAVGGVNRSHPLSAKQGSLSLV